MTFTLTQLILFVTAAVVITSVVVAVCMRKRDNKRLSFMLDALEDGELNFRFRDTNSFNRTLNRIRSLFERQRQAGEQESWTKLIRVLTHEIMNTVSPIASLSDALAQSLDEHGHSNLDMKHGLETISDSSHNLMRFVENYRRLSGVDKPVRKATVLKDMVEKVLSLNREQIIQSNAACLYHADVSGLVVYADEGQIMQVFNNLILNAVQAGATKIDITAHADRNDSIHVTVANNGTPIPLVVQEQIFTPFYTTKPHGSGIGLSVARQIMLGHSGSLSLTRSDNELTVFELVFR